MRKLKNIVHSHNIFVGDLKPAMGYSIADPKHIPLLHLDFQKKHLKTHATYMNVVGFSKLSCDFWYSLDVDIK